MRLRNSLLAVAAIACATLGTSAYAGQDSKILAGNACQFADVTTIVNPSFAFDSGRILNTADIPVSVICPVVRDNTTNTDGTLAVQVRVNGGNDQDVLCTVTSRDRFAKFRFYRSWCGGITRVIQFSDRSCLTGSKKR